MSRRSGAMRRNVHAHAGRVVESVWASDWGARVPPRASTLGPFPVRHDKCGVTVGEYGIPDADVSGDGLVLAWMRPWPDRDDVADVVAWLCPRCRVPVGTDLPALTAMLNLYSLIHAGDTRYLTVHRLTAIEQAFV